LLSVAGLITCISVIVISSIILHVITLRSRMPLAYKIFCTSAVSIFLAGQLIVSFWADQAPDKSQLAWLIGLLVAQISLPMLMSTLNGVSKSET
jgi:hypothetical protein